MFHFNLTIILGSLFSRLDFLSVRFQFFFALCFDKSPDVNKVKLVRKLSKNANYSSELYRRQIVWSINPFKFLTWILKIPGYKRKKWRLLDLRPRSNLESFHALFFLYKSVGMYLLMYLLKYLPCMYLYSSGAPIGLSQDGCKTVGKIPSNPYMKKKLCQIRV